MTHIYNKGRISTNLSIDRIDSLKGYTKDNIQLVCHLCNLMKSNLSMNELYIFCNNIIKYRKEVTND